MINTQICRNCSFIAATLIVILSGAASAEVIRGEGGSIAFETFNGTVNDSSSLNRQWVIVNDEHLPVELTRFQIRPALGTAFAGFHITYSIELQAPVSAIELIFIPFDIWGAPSRPMAATHIQDFPAGPQEFDSSWSGFSTSDVSDHFVMIGFVAQVRLESGEVKKANLDGVIEEARRLSESFGADNLSRDQ